METKETKQECKCYPPVTIGDKAPDFVAVTTHGNLKFSNYIKDSWAVLFSHPADFTPVCTTEFLGFALKQEEFDKRNVKLVGLSIDSIYSHIAWIRQIEEKFEVEIKFPVIADLPMAVAKQYGMIHPKVSTTHAVRCIYLIDPNFVVRSIIVYPMNAGRNIDEIIRLIDAMQLSDKESIATPANWQKGDSVIIPPPATKDEAEKRMHEKHEECVDWFLCKKKV